MTFKVPINLPDMVEDFHSLRRVVFRNKRIASLSLCISVVLIFLTDPLHLTQTSPKIRLSTARRQTPAIFSSPHFSSSLPSFSTNDLQIANGTLGFSAIIALGLPDRSDKRDAMELAASVTNLQLTWVDGTSGSQMNPKAAPPNWKLDGVLGAWRGHMNVMQTIVKNNMASALVLEDDADWDVHIVSQMQRLAAVTQELLELKPRDNGSSADGNRGSGSPYGEDWDILWIGHLGGWPAQSLSKASAIIRNDSTVPPALAIQDLLGNPDKWNANCSAHLGRDPKGKRCDAPRLQSDERIVMQNARPLCSYAYAVSLRGAQKFLARAGGVSLDDVKNPVDVELGSLCAGDKDLPGEETTCLSVAPPYIRSHRPKGLLSGDSDIRSIKKDGKKRQVGLTEGVMWSTRMNAVNIITGLELESQYIEDVGTWRLRKADEYRRHVKV